MKFPTTDEQPQVVKSSGKNFWNFFYKIPPSFPNNIQLLTLKKNFNLYQIQKKKKKYFVDFIDF